MLNYKMQIKIVHSFLNRRISMIVDRSTEEKLIKAKIVIINYSKP